MGVGADAWGSDSSVDCLEDTLRKLVQPCESKEKPRPAREARDPNSADLSLYVFSDHRTPSS